MRSYTVVLSVICISLVTCGPEAGNATIEWFEGDISSLYDIAQQEGKDIFIYVYSDHCGHCTEMKKTAFSNRSVTTAINTFFIPVLAEKTSDFTKYIKDTYHIRSYPTFLIITWKGIEIDRLVGSRKTKIFLSEITRIHNNINTLAYYLDKLEQYPDDIHILNNVFKKYIERKDVDSAIDISHQIETTNEMYFHKNKYDIFSNIQKASYYSGHYPITIEYSHKLLHEFPEKDMKRQYSYIASSYRMMEEFKKMYDTYKTMLILFPKDISIYYRILHNAALTGQFLEEAIALGMEGLAQPCEAKEKAQLHYSIAQVCRKMEAYEKAYESAKAAAALHNDKKYRSFIEEMDIIMSGGTLPSQDSNTLSFSLSEWEINTKNNDTVQETTLIITNRGIHAAEIKLYPSWSCLVAEPSVTIAGAGKKSEIKLLYDPSRDTGTGKKQFIIRTTVINQERIILPVYLFTNNNEVKTGSITLHYYYDTGCTSCINFIKKTIPALEKELGININVELKNIQNTGVYEAYKKLINKLGENERAFPALIIGNTLLQGSMEINADIKAVLVSAL
jgi:thioredoxin-related protein